MIPRVIFKATGLTSLSAIATIVRLHSCIYPSAVIRLIIPIRIDPIDSAAHVWRFWVVPGVHGPISKRAKVIEPGCAYLDAASSIIGEVSVLWIVASLSHAKPYLIEPCPGLAMLDPTLRIKASTTLSQAASQASKNYLGLISTITLAEP